MKYYRLHIDTDGTESHYNEVTGILGVQPTHFPLGKFDTNPFDLWTYAIDIADDNPYDFITEFLNLLEPKFLALEKAGIFRKEILFWFIYEYTSQCAMEFHPQEMERLGKSGIHLNIDCLSSRNQIDNP